MISYAMESPELSKLQKLIETTKNKKYRNLKLKPREYDERICKILGENESEIEHFDANFFVECFVNGLDKSVLHILNKNEGKARTFFTKRTSITIH